MSKLVTVAIATAILCTPAMTHAFCGFYVAGSGKPMFNDATQVVLMREGTRTVLSMQNNYKGPPDAFAMVIPVPTVLQESDVKVLPREVFALVDQLGSPRLVEYWERDPCEVDPPEEESTDESGGAGTAMALEEGKLGKRDLGVKVEAKFAVGEYQIVILSAKDSTGLDTWLREEKYTIPPNAAPLLRPYVEAGMKFFVAKIDPAKVKFVDGRAELSPLRFHYDSETFTLPIRLGLANSSGTQDLIVNIIASKRYEVANYPNVTIPTNITVKNEVRDRFGEFYVALFDATMAKNPGAIVTEYSWDVSGCDPCPGPALDYGDIMTLGGDVTGEASQYTLTRLHARYGKQLKDDLEFSTAGPIGGGREIEVAPGKLEQGWEQSKLNNFQARYVIRHPWKGVIDCRQPIRNRWGADPGSSPDKSNVKPGVGLAFAPRTLELASAILSEIRELDLLPAKGKLRTRAAAASRSGCGCSSGDASGLGLLALVLVALPRRRRYGRNALVRTPLTP